ncbi:MAG: hypothetical protein WC510_01415 [Candidatus Omnitrophota bacterium]
MKKNILAFIGFTVLTIVMTYPLFFKITDHIAGFSSTDEPSVWYFWWLKYAYLHKIPSSFSLFVSAPFGFDLGIFQRLYPICIGIRKLLVIPFNEFVAWNLEILAGFILSAFFVYLTTRYLVKDRTAAFFSGIIFAFCPYHFVRAWQHIGFSQTQWLALFLFSILLLKAKTNKKNIILVFLSLYLVFSFDLYYAYFALFIASVFIIYLLLKKQKGSFKIIFWVAIVSLANLGILASRLIPLMGTIKIDISPSAWNIVRPFDDLFSQSARPLSYFLPSTEHPIFGWLTRSFVGSKLYGTSFTEHALYLGWVPLILAFVAIMRWRKDRGKGYEAQGDAAESFHIGFLIFLAIAAWLFSQPPWWNWFGLRIYMPSFFLYKILPMFRAYCRFGIILMLAVAVLAGFGLKYILEKFKTQRTKMAIAILFYGLVLFEFWNYPPFKIIPFKAPQVYYWLKAQEGDFTIAEYPLDVKGPNEIYKSYQTKHEKRIINGTIPGTYPNKVSRSILRLSSEYAAGVLKYLGVKYVLVHKDDYLRTGLLEDEQEPALIAKNKGLRLVKSFPPESCAEGDIRCTDGVSAVDVYEVLAKPEKKETIDVRAQ